MTEIEILSQLQDDTKNLKDFMVNDLKQAIKEFKEQYKKITGKTI